ncbi:long-chain-fatty-acid--CoA ligase [Heyndrickxia coagulans]|uniref:AMP-dependent synthetase and ligase n=1 Tax=Heyndrickxia coagulans 36D1 TaxID=345219 RepID=G2TRF3_HEYCO|nr:long-chain fatty acid--CoA ligase [Heyndrickxia coagulans]AEP00229.1 AMP-dependent synthetase and ligase [Heyndrickxia coagulans 36D1]
MENKVWHAVYTDEIPKEIEVLDIPLYQILATAAEKYPDRTALSFYGRKTPYAELYKASLAFASSLQKRGVQKGSRVAVMLPNCPHYVVSYYGALMAGAMVVQINPMLVEPEIRHILNDSGAETIIVLDDLYPKVQAVRPETSLKNVVIAGFKPAAGPLDEAEPFDALLQAGTDYNPPALDPWEDIAVLQYTGGTTGRSKGAMLTHRNLLANLVQTYEFFKPVMGPGKERILTVIPLFHVFGMTCAMNYAIYTGSESVMLPRFDLEEVLKTIKETQPTYFPGVPTMYVAITNHPKAMEYGLDSIKTCNSGSAPMPLGLLRQFEEKTGSVIVEGYGLSEASPVTHCNPVFGKRKPGSIGIAIPSTDYKIVDVATGTEELKPGETGELIVKGPQVMKGYWNMPEETAEALRDGWLYTGDIATMDEEGYAYIVDRKKDMIIASGYNVYPRDVEEVLYAHPAVQEAVVIGVPDPYRGETVKAFVVLKEGQKMTEEALIEYASAHLAPYKRPKIIEFRDALPKTNVGKILRRKLRDEERKVRE